MPLRRPTTQYGLNYQLSQTQGQQPLGPRDRTHDLSQLNPNSGIAGPHENQPPEQVALQQALVPTAPRYQRGGVSHEKWMNPEHNTPKYEALRILDQVDPRTLGTPGFANLPENVKKQLTDKGYSIYGEDKLFRDDIGEFDVLHGDREEYGWRATGVGNNAPIRPSGQANLPNPFTFENPLSFLGRSNSQPGADYGQQLIQQLLQALATKRAVQG